MCAGAAGCFTRMSVLKHRAKFCFALPPLRPFALGQAVEGKEFGFYLLQSCLMQDVWQRSTSYEM